MMVIIPAAAAEGLGGAVGSTDTAAAAAAEAAALAPAAAIQPRRGGFEDVVQEPALFHVHVCVQLRLGLFGGEALCRS